MAELSGAITSDNKFYALRRCGAVAPHVLGSPRQRSRTTRTPGGVFSRVAASRYDHILTCCEDPASQNVSVKSTLGGHCAPLESARGYVGQSFQVCECVGSCHWAHLISRWSHDGSSNFNRSNRTVSYVASCFKAGQRGNGAQQNLRAAPLRCRGSSGARPCAAKIAAPGTPGGVFGRAREPLRANFGGACK